MSESEILAGVLELLQYLQNQGKCHVVRLNSGMAFVGDGKRKYVIKLCPIGTADVQVLTTDGEGHTVVYYFETKVPGGKQSPAQAQFQADVEAQGASYFIIQDVQQAIDIVEGW